MKKILIIAVFVAWASGASAKTPLVPGSDDIPLMAGLQVQDNMSFVFDTPSGRIVEAFAILPADQKTADVDSYYEKTLASMGWQNAGDTFYLRDSQKLDIKFENISGKNLVHFLITPTLIKTGSNN